MRKFVLRLASAALVGGVVLSACSSSDGTDPGGPSASGGFDEDVDPDALVDYMGKADGDPCATHSGGALAGDDLLIVVNKDEPRQLRADWRPSDLVPIDAGDMMPGRTGEVRIAAMRAYQELAAVAKAEAGLDLGIRSAFRSFETQCFTFNYWVDERGYEHASNFSARPGRSEHQLGTAIDITAASVGWELTQEMADTPEGIWLEANAHRFGFGLSYPDGYEDLSGYSYEPWHWRYIGREAAAEMAATGLKLIEYLLACEAGDPNFDCPREEAPKLDPNEGFIGGECASEQDCSTLDEPRMCLLDSYPGGHCTIPCTLYCPDRAGSNAATFCVATEDEPTVGTCHSKCDQTLFPGTGCREGYACSEASRPNGAGTGSVCLPQ
jgi:LAS superfamily LD-carboxypeptidase LdcB